MIKSARASKQRKDVSDLGDNAETDDDVKTDVISQDGVFKMEVSKVDGEETIESTEVEDKNEYRKDAMAAKLVPTNPVVSMCMKQVHKLEQRHNPIPDVVE